MTISDFIDNLLVSSSNFTAEFINQMRNIMNKNNINEVFDVLKNYTVVLKNEKVKHSIDYTCAVVTSFDADGSDTTNHNQVQLYTRKIPNTILADSLLFTNSGTWVFPLEGSTMGGLSRLAGTQYIKVDPYNSSTQMDLGSGGFSISWNHKKTTTGTYGIFCKRDMSNTTNAGVEIWVNSTTINCRIADGTNTSLCSVTFANLNDGNRHTIVCNVPNSGNLEIFVDKISQGTQPRGSVANLTNVRSAYIFARDNAGTIQDSFSGDAGLFSWKREVMSTQDITDFHDNYLLNYKSASNTEILTFPFHTTNENEPNSMEGGFSA